MAYKTSDFRKGLKVQIDGEPYLMTEMNFVKPGKGNALYKCRLKNLIRGTTLQKTYKGGDTLEEADVHEVNVQYLYKQADTYVFMHTETLRPVRIVIRASRRKLEVPEGRYDLPDDVFQWQSHRS